METIKIALYGKYGTRKTLQIRKLVEAYGPERVWVVSAEHGLQTLGDSVPPDHIKVVGGLEDMRAAYAWASKVAAEDHWVCNDGMSRVMQWVANEQLSGADKYFELVAMGEQESAPDNLKPFGRYMTDRGKMDTMRVYGRIGRDSENLLSAWIRLKCNLYCNYLEDQTSNGTEKGQPFTPDVPGSVGLKAVMSSFDHVIRDRKSVV